MSLWLLKWRRFSISKLATLLLAFFCGLLASCVFYSSTLEKTTLCQENLSLVKVNHHKILLIVLIFTSPFNTERRKCIRETWLQLNFSKNYILLHYFAIGTSSLSPADLSQLESENRLNKDLLLISELIDNYNNLTHKLLFSLKAIALHHANEYHYLLKVDDDSFVRLDVIAEELLERVSVSNLKPIYWGFFDGRAHVKRSGPWAEARWFLCDRYLPYALGGGYLISQDLVAYIDKNSDLLQVYHSEDVSLGTWLAPLDIDRRHDARFDTEFKSRGCINRFVIQHKQSTLEMKTKYKSVVSRGRLCAQGEVEHRLAYQYNWTIQPSKCCTRNLSLLTAN